LSPKEVGNSIYAVVESMYISPMHKQYFQELSQILQVMANTSDFEKIHIVSPYIGFHDKL